MSRKSDILRRRAVIADLLLKGYTTQEIIDELHLSTKTGEGIVSADLRAIRQHWKDSALRDYNEHKGEQLAKLVAIQKELFAAWKRSQGEETTVSIKSKKVRMEDIFGEEERPKPRTSTERAKLANTPTFKMTETEQFQTVNKQAKRDGNPVFTKQLMECIAQQCELLGLVTKAGDLSSSPPVVSFNIRGPAIEHRPQLADEDTILLSSEVKTVVTDEDLGNTCKDVVSTNLLEDNKKNSTSQGQIENNYFHKRHTELDFSQTKKVTDTELEAEVAANRGVTDKISPKLADSKNNSSKSFSQCQEQIPEKEEISQDSQEDQEETFETVDALKYLQEVDISKLSNPLEYLLYGRGVEE